LDLLWIFDLEFCRRKSRAGWSAIRAVGLGRNEGAIYRRHDRKAATFDQRYRTAANVLFHDGLLAQVVGKPHLSDDRRELGPQHRLDLDMHRRIAHAHREPAGFELRREFKSITTVEQIGVDWWLVGKLCAGMARLPL